MGELPDPDLTAAELVELRAAVAYSYEAGDEPKELPPRIAAYAHAPDGGMLALVDLAIRLAERVDHSQELARGYQLLTAGVEQEITDLREQTAGHAETARQATAHAVEQAATIARLEEQLRGEGNRVGRLEDQLRTACTAGADAQARAADLEALLPREISDPALLDTLPVGSVIVAAEQAWQCVSRVAAVADSDIVLTLWMPTRGTTAHPSGFVLGEADGAARLVWQPPCYRCGATHLSGDDLCSPCERAVKAETTPRLVIPGE